MSEQSHRGIYFGRLFGIRFYLDYSWFVIAAMLTYIFGASFFPIQLPGLQPLTYFALALVTALLFFLSILLHELGHSVVSQRCGIPVPRITLLFIGGIAEISREPEDPKSELKIALAGPLVTLVLIGVYQALAWMLRPLGFGAAALVFQVLAIINLQLIIFNMIPGYPLDGGRVLRALLWARSGNARRATYITSRIGVGFSWVLIAIGALLLFQGHWNGFVAIVIGLFLKAAAQGGYLQTLYHEMLSGVRVAEIMCQNPVTIPAQLPLNLAVDDFFLTNHHVAFPVVDADGEFRGLLRLEHLKSLPKQKWPFTTASELASQLATQQLCVARDEPAGRALRRLLVPGQGRLAVLQENSVVGIITRHDILQFIKIRTELES